METTERIYCERATSAQADISDAGDALMWHSASYDNGSPIMSAYTTKRPPIMLLDTATSCPWLICAGRHQGWDAIAPVPYVGALATILSDLVEVVR